MTFKEVREKLEREYPDMGWDEVDKMAAEMSADYIKRSDAINAISDKLIDGSNASYSAKWFNTGMQTAMSVLDILRGEEVAPVVHGKWIKCRKNYSKCSECGTAYNHPVDWVPDKYCSECGEKMIMEE